MRISDKTVALLLLCYLLGFVGCTTEIEGYQDCLRYLANEKNGLLKRKSSSGLAIQVKYLPASFMAAGEIAKNSLQITSGLLDSIGRLYENQHSFLLTIGPDADEPFDVTTIGVSNYQEFAERIVEMSFDMDEYLALEVNGKRIPPQITEMESLYGLRQSRDFMVLFPARDAAGVQLVKGDFFFIFSDEIFLTGIHKFRFRLKDIQKVPFIKTSL